MLQTNGRHAFLVMSRSYSHQLNFLLEQLDYSDNSIYLHVDKKAKSNGINLYYPKHASIHEIDREDVNWAAFSLVKVELSLLKEASKDGPYEYYHLLSESDLPIKSNAKIHEYFEDKDIEFVNIESINQKNDIRRIKYFFPLQEKAGKKHGTYWAMQKILMYIQMILHINRLKGNNFKLYAKGSEWFSITDDFVNYILSQEKVILKVFNYGQATDEMFIQTLLMNSSFKDKISNVSQGNLRFIQWKKGNSPQVLIYPEDAKKMVSSECMFARKFNFNTGNELMRKIAELRK